MVEILQNKNSASRFQILVEIAARGPGIRQNAIAASLGFTPQAISDYIRQLTEEDLVLATGRATYKVSAKGVNWMSGLADAINGGVELNDGEVLTEAHALVTIDGTIQTGANRHKSLVLSGWDKATGQITSYTATPGITFTSSQEKVKSSLLKALENAKEQKVRYPDNVLLQNFYNGEISRIAKTRFLPDILPIRNVFSIHPRCTHRGKRVCMLSSEIRYFVRSHRSYLPR